MIIWDDFFFNSASKQLVQMRGHNINKNKRKYSSIIIKFSLSSKALHDFEFNPL